MATTPLRKVTITFKSTEAQSPVYVAASFTQPAWQPLEMSALPATAAGQPLLFSRDFHVPVGRWQYKFCLAHDIWLCDESKPKLEDDAGNVNNLLLVEMDGTDDRTKSSLAGEHEASETAQLPESGSGPAPDDGQADADSANDTPLLPHEQPSVESASQSDEEDLLDRSPKSTAQNDHVVQRASLVAPAPTSKDLDDPTIEVFPGTKAGILRRMETLQLELPADVTARTEPNVPHGQKLARRPTTLVNAGQDKADKFLLVN